MKAIILALALSFGLMAQAPFQVKVTGHGRPMILLPGLSCPGEVWDGTVAHYKDHYEMHVISLAGFAGIARVPAPFLATAREAIADYIRKNNWFVRRNRGSIPARVICQVSDGNS